MAYITAITKIKNGRLVGEREKRGFNQRAMAQFLNIGYTQYNCYENFSVMPNEKRCLEIASKLGVMPEGLFDDYAKVYIAAEIRGSNVIRQEIEKEKYELLMSDSTLKMLPAATSDQEIAIIQKDLSEALSIALKQLNPREEKVLRMYHGIGGSMIPHTFSEIAEAMDISRERVRQIKEKALSKLQSRDNHNTPDLEALRATFHDLMDAE